MNFRPDVREFLNQFFGQGNLLTLDSIEMGQGKYGRLLPWLQRLTGPEPGSTVLPRKLSENHVIWYGIAGNDKQFRSLSELLFAFVGPTWSDFRGGRANLDSNDPVEASVLTLTGGSACRIEGNLAELWSALELMRVVLEHTVERVFEMPRPTGRVLRDFFMAVRAGNLLSAEDSLLYLKTRFRLETLNLLFLKIYLLSEFQRWEEILALPELPNVLQVRRPSEVTHTVIKAVYKQKLSAFEAEGDSEGAASYFHNAILPEYGNLYSVRGGSENPEVIKSFMLLAVGGKTPRPDLRDELLSIKGLGKSDTSYLQNLATLLPETLKEHPPADGLGAFRDAIYRGDFDQAFSLTQFADGSLQWARLQFECAYELQSLDAERAAVAAYFRLSPSDRNDFLSVRWNRDYLEKLTGLTLVGKLPSLPEELIPGDWVQWLERLREDPTWERALNVAKQGATEWSFDELASSPEKLKWMGELIQSLVDNTTLHNALPFLLAFFQREKDWQRRDCLPVYRILLDVLVLSTLGGNDDLVIFNELAAAMFTLGVDEKAYSEVLDYAQELWRRNASASKMDWALDFLDLLIAQPCPAPTLRTQMLFLVAESAKGFVRRLDDGQKDLFRLLINDLHQESALSDLLSAISPGRTEESSVLVASFEKLQSRSIAIYTLTESVGERVKRVLEAKCPETRISLSNEKVGSERLRQLARNADIFLMATASAKHAATEFIEEHRPKNLPLLRPAGKGSASMLRALREHLESAAAGQIS